MVNAISTRITVPLSHEEAQAIIKMAETQYRHPREQARFLLREALICHGLLIAANAPGGPDGRKESSHDR